MHKEPSIFINGVSLNDAQSATVRVALESFYSQLKDDDSKNDITKVRKSIFDLYCERIDEVRKIMLDSQ